MEYISSWSINFNLNILQTQWSFSFERSKDMWVCMIKWQGIMQQLFCAVILIFDCKSQKCEGKNANYCTGMIREKVNEFLLKPSFLTVKKGTQYRNLCASYHRVYCDHSCELNLSLFFSKLGRWNHSCEWIYLVFHFSFHLTFIQSLIFQANSKSHNPYTVLMTMSGKGWAVDVEGGLGSCLLSTLCNTLSLITEKELSNYCTQSNIWFAVKQFLRGAGWTIYWKK